MQTITTRGGETLVVLPLADYEALVDAADIRAAERVKADIAAGRDELVPDEVVGRLLAGENPIRVWRTFRGMTALDLSKAASLSAPYVSQIETGKREGTVAALKAIAAVLNVDMDDLV